ncbi:MAG: hypothetical protein SVW02_00915 [Candidatus Nanohaloarchaea archaeon]|nr:hypothetical protein [Candidatus Nanohaloarchaea archaeon]
MYEHPIQDEETLQKHMEAADEVRSTDHFEKDVIPDRPSISKEMVEEYLQRFDDLLAFTHQEDTYDEEKYVLIFDKSSTYYLKIVVSFADSCIYLITAHLINRNRGDPEDLIER